MNTNVTAKMPQPRKFFNPSLHLFKEEHILTELINALPGNSSINTVQYATIEEAVFSVDPIDALIDWLDSDHVMFTVGSCPFSG
jgi:hypothetical protein